MYILDIFMKFITAYYEKAVCITDKKDITMNYLQGWFSYDLISLIPFLMELVDIEFGFKFWNILVFMKLPTFFRIVNNVNDMLLSNQIMMNVFALVKLFLYVTFVAHLFCLIWLGFAYILYKEQYVQKTWIIEQNLEEEYWLVQYIWSFYFATATMTTVGYGDITPSNEYEAVILIFGLVIASGLFAYLFNSVGGLIDEITSSYKEFKKQASLVNIYLKKKNCPPILQLQVNKFLEYKYQSEKELSIEEEKSIIQKLPDNMQEEIKFQQAMFVIKSNNQIFNRFSQSVQHRLAMKIREIQLNKNQNIFEQNEISDDPCLYFIQSGAVDMYALSYKGDQQITVLNSLKEQQTFGEHSFITGQARKLGAQSTKPSILCYIKRSDFLQVVQKSYIDQEIYCMFRDKLIFDNNYLTLGQKCYACLQYGHYSSSCYLLNIQNDEEKIILENKFQQWQFRDYQKSRTEIMQYHSLLDNTLIKERQIDLQNDLLELEEQKQNLKQLQSILEDKQQNLDPVNISPAQDTKYKKLKSFLNKATSNLHLLQDNSRKISIIDQSNFLKNISNQLLQEQLLKQKIFKKTLTISDSESSSQSDYDSKNSEEQSDSASQSQEQYKNSSNNNLQKNNNQINEKIENLENLNSNYSIVIDKNQEQDKLPSVILEQEKHGDTDFPNLNIKQFENDKIIREQSVSNTDTNQNPEKKDSQILDKRKVSSFNKFSFKKLMTQQIKINDQPNKQQKYSLMFHDSKQKEAPVSILTNKKKILFQEPEQKDISSNQTSKNTIDMSNKKMTHRYSTKLENQFQSNLQNKQQQLQDILNKIKTDNAGQYQSLQNDCEIKLFQYYFPQNNINLQNIVHRYNWAQTNLAKTPEFGIYTIKERKIQLKQFQTFEAYLKQIKIKEQLQKQKKREQLLKKSPKKTSSQFRFQLQTSQRQSIYKQMKHLVLQSQIEVEKQNK